MPEPLVQIEILDAAAILTMNRPEKHNALSRGLLIALTQALDDLHGERDVRAVVLTAGGSTFCSGLDLAEIHAGDQADDAPQVRHRDAQALGDLLEKMLRFPKALIAAVDGPAMGAGAALALACDMVVASESASVSFPEPRRGLVGAVVAPLLVFRAGAGPAGYLLLSGRLVDAATAARWGLFHEVVPSGRPLDRAQALAADVAQGAPEAIQLTKRMLNETIGEHLSTLFCAGAAASATARTTEAATEGLSAFLEKRNPHWP